MTTNEVPPDVIEARELAIRNKPERIFTPCCRGEAVLSGKPAPRYTCDACGAVFTSLASFVANDK